jgi:chitodextrinase/uncharacterized protein YjbI with pentapeptide repeats
MKMNLFTPPAVVLSGCKKRTRPYRIVCGLLVLFAPLFTACEIVPEEKDTTPPAAVSDLNGIPGNGQIMLAWTDPPDSDLDHIEITWNGERETSPKSAAVNRANRVTIKNLSNGTAYTFSVTAVDATGNRSDSKTLTETPSGAPDTPPGDVAFLTGIPDNGQVRLSWTDPPDKDLFSIEITWTPGGTAVQSVSAGAETYTATGLNNGTAYTFSVTAVDAAGQKSGGQTVRATPAPALTSFDEISAFLDAAPGGTTIDNPVPLTVALHLSKPYGYQNSTWTSLVWAIGDSGKYVALDLTACTMEDDDDLWSCMRFYEEGVITDKLVSLTLPAAATSIPSTSSSDNIFNPFENLKSVSGANIVSIGSSSLENCTALERISFPKAETIESNFAFRNCSALVSVNLPSVKTIGGGAFDDCTSLTAISLPAATNTGGFMNCTALETVDFPAATSIDGNGFRNCTALRSVSFPKVETIGSATFGGCSALISADFPLAKTIHSTAFSALRALETVHIPLVETIGGSAFRYCAALKEVNLPLVKSIGDEAFSECTALEELDLPAVESIGHWAFSECTALKAAALPVVKTIGAQAFTNTALVSVNLPMVETIGNNAFADCSFLESAEIPLVEIIAESLFARCNLRSVNAPKATSIGNYAFVDCALTSVDFPKVTSIGNNAFIYCDMTSVDFPEAVSVGREAFSHTPLKSIAFPKATSIDDSAFEECSALEEVILPAVETIGDNAFLNNTALTWANLSAATSVESFAFRNCTKLEAVNLPVATSIGTSAFFGCKVLNEVSLPAAVSIGDGVFYSCTTLEELSLPAAKTIGNNAFRECTALKKLELLMVTSIGSGAFLSTGTVTIDITLPKNAPSIATASDSASAYQKLVIVRTPAGGTGYDAAWEANMKQTFGQRADITLNISGIY